MLGVFGKRETVRIRGAGVLAAGFEEDRKGSRERISFAAH